MVRSILTEKGNAHSKHKSVSLSSATNKAQHLIKRTVRHTGKKTSTVIYFKEITN